MNSQSWFRILADDPHSPSPIFLVMMLHATVVQTLRWHRIKSSMSRPVRLLRQHGDTPWQVGRSTPSLVTYWIFQQAPRRTLLMLVIRSVLKYFGYISRLNFHRVPSWHIWRRSQMLRPIVGLAVGGSRSRRLAWILPVCLSSSCWACTRWQYLQLEFGQSQIWYGCQIED